MAEEDWLTAKEVRVILRMDDSRTFTAFCKSQPLFPRPFSIGLTKTKKPILRWSKSAVIGFMALMAAQREIVDIGGAEDDPE